MENEEEEATVSHSSRCLSPNERSSRNYLFSFYFSFLSVSLEFYRVLLCAGYNYGNISSRGRIWATFVLFDVEITVGGKTSGEREALQKWMCVWPPTLRKNKDAACVYLIAVIYIYIFFLKKKPGWRDSVPSSGRNWKSVGGSSSRRRPIRQSLFHFRFSSKCVVKCLSFCLVKHSNGHLYKTTLLFW